ncbi:MAG: hypothetical protein HC862_20870 [Scytonema sp. RU_4_4]|nr:hypothetical protein [Scytonema sp. RU_4_4]
MTQLKERNSEESLIAEVKSLVKKARQRKFTFLLVGRTGVGKSSTINTLIGEKVAKVGKFQPVTENIGKYEYNIEGIPCTVVDTPGLADTSDKDEQYISSIKSAVPEPDSMWFVTRLDESRVRDDERKTIKTISKAFGKQAWEKAIIVFTHADKVKSDDYNEYLTTRTKLIQEEIANYVNTDIAQQIPSVAVANNPEDRPKSLPTPNGEPWLNELYTTVIKRISDNGLLPITMATAPRVRPQDAKSQKILSSSEAEPILLNERHKPQIRERIERSPEFAKVMEAAAGAIGAAIGGEWATGAVGAVIGGEWATGAVGAVIGGAIAATSFTPIPIILAAKFFGWLSNSDSRGNLAPTNDSSTNEDISIQNLGSSLEANKLNDLRLKIQELNQLQDEDDWSFHICSNYVEISKTFKAAPNVESFIKINIEKAEPIVINLDLTLSPNEIQDSLPYIAIMGFYPSKAVRSIVTNLSLVNEFLEVVIEDIFVLLDPDEQELPTENIPSFSTQVILFAVDCKENQ